MSEIPITSSPRRLRDWLNPTGERKVHSLVDKVYKQKNLALAWEKVKSNGGAGGIDHQSIEEFEADAQRHLLRLHEELVGDSYQPQPVRQQLIPKAGQPGKFRPLGIPTIYDRVCQQALLNRLEPIFEPLFDDASFGYRRGRSAKGALGKIWRELRTGHEWVVDADLKNFFGTVDQKRLLALVGQRVADSRVLRLLRSMLEAGCMADGERKPTTTGVPQGGVVSPVLSNILLTPFDREMRTRGYQLTRYADDWVITCRTREDAQRALAEATAVLTALGVTLNTEKTRIVHAAAGFEFLGYRIKRGNRPMRLASSKIRSGVRSGDFYAYPTQRSLQRFKEQIRLRTRRKAPVTTGELIAEINPIIRGWGLYYCKAHVRGLFNRLTRWIVQRIWSHRYKRWRCCGWRALPERRLYGEMRLVNLLSLIPSLAPQRGCAFVKARCGKSARRV
jgi:RNA-directed DNA polymerase